MAVSIGFGEAVIVDRGVYHAGHKGDGKHDVHAMHISNDNLNDEAE